MKFIPTKGSRVCSKHFSTDMIDEVGQRVILKPNAVPTIFPSSQVCVFVSLSIIILSHFVLFILNPVYDQHIFP